ncbi:MAG TPA: 3-deoxy-D-manno-octulosonate 8-phosphate phosphatase [Flavobacteriales bacterium]|nr:3-deoxy-D-manno-octulosonate 8-phosphate phosphatase [Flavobacteriales bacterium]HNK83686.1 3-deoxy-D-manno-octulosonate 8-phosphate phosphatase [Flavobacteriales bacterium]HNO04315.1 3-deoxy-D-manno-octulosonate 8-phosphate phosphatase [Flavobacteriales bacterium]
MASRTYKEILANIDHFLIDADGVLTDNRVLLFPGIDPVRSFHSRDSYALQHAVKEGLRVAIVSGGRSQGMDECLARLGVKDRFFNVADKSAKLDELIASGLDPSRTAYMGDDIPDLRAMTRVALPCCPADAAEEVKAISRYISPKPGGMGCVRDLLEQALKARGRWLTENAHTW